MTAGFLVVVILLNVVVSLLAERYPLHEPGPHRGPCQHPFGQRGGNRLNVQNPTTIYIMAS